MAKDTDLIKEKVDLTDFIRSYVTLSPAGKNLKGLCPFHQERTPSFMVSPERKMWHCFGCGLGGDVIKFAMLYEHLEFPEALRFLAEKAGISIQTLSPTQQREFGILYDLHEEAKNFYKAELSKNPAALKYLKDRGLTSETIDEFDLGFSPGGETLTVNLLKKGHAVGDLVRAGLVQKSTSGLYRDKFFERIIFPIANQVGKVVAFTGRLTPEAEAKYKDSPTPPPKYLNSPETPIFNKSRTLYGFDKTKQSISESRSALLVEGQMDFLGAWQAGVKNLVAVSGTGLTPYHLEKLRRFADIALVSFDNDAAGLKALERSLDYFNNFDFHVKVIDLGKYKDPADAAKADPNFLKDAITLAKPAFDYIFGVYFAPDVFTEDIPKRKRIIRHLLGMLKPVKSAVEQNIWIKELSKKSGISESALTEELSNTGELASAGIEEETDITGAPLPNYLDAVARRLVSLALTKENFLIILKANSQLLPPLYQKILDDPTEEARGLLELQSSYEFASTDEVKLEKEFQDLMKRLEVVDLRERQSSLKRALKTAQDKNNDESVNKFLSDFSDVTKRLNDLNT
ncbi:DNA primase [bacterium]|nr:MAG: DNA primase [bacterium]